MVAKATAAMEGALTVDHEIVTAHELGNPVGYAHAVVAAPGTDRLPGRPDGVAA